MEDNRRNNKPLILCFASGKGGTGKTTIATNLARILAPKPTVFLDCDVEEPNSHLFFDLHSKSEKVYRIFVPEVDMDLCTACGKCAELCQFGTLVRIKNKVLIFPELCHSCLGCQRICPNQAIKNSVREIGVVIRGRNDHIHFFYGILRVGESMVPPLITEVKRWGFSQRLAEALIIDTPPGTSCQVIESVKGSDVVVLVTEPTPFGLHDLKLAVKMINTLKIPPAVVINRSTIGNSDVYQFCHQEKIPILMEIPEDRLIAETFARGQCLVDALPIYRSQFKLLLNRVKEITA